MDRRPPEWDYALHLERVVNCHRILAEPAHAWLAEIIAESSFYPPIVTCVAGLLFHPRRLAETGMLELLDVKALAIERLVITELDLSEFLRGQRGLGGVRVALEEGRARITLALPGPDLTAPARVLPASGGGPFALQADDVRYGALRLPRWLVGSIVRNFEPTPRLRQLPVAVSLAPVRITAGRIEVGGAAGAPAPAKDKR